MKGLIDIFRTVFLLAVTGWMLSCTEGRPDDILSRAEMVEVMEELYIVEEKVNHLGLSRDSAKKVSEKLTTKVFESAALNDSVFKKSFDYYMERPREMELIYTALVDTLQLREQRAPYKTENHQ